MSTCHNLSKQLFGKGLKKTVMIALMILAMITTAGCVGNGSMAEASGADENGGKNAETVAEIDRETEVVQAEAPVIPVVSEEESWKTMLINITHPLPDGYVPELTTVDGTNYKMDARIAENMNRMLADCRAAGYDPIICSSYRTWEKQTQLFEKQVKKQQGFGLNYEDAYEKAKTVVAYPGTSEHQTGLTADICAKNHQVLDDSQANQPTQQWLMANSWKYGFILRFPLGKSEYTKIIWEPWHYRYVGEEVAQYIFENDLCLEEYWMLIDEDIAEEYAPVKAAEEEKLATEAETTETEEPTSSEVSAEQKQ